MTAPFETARTDRDRLEAVEKLLEQQTELLGKLAGQVRQSHSAMAAAIALAQALIESHPEPAVLSSHFMDQMDTMGSVLSADDITLYRDDMQKLHLHILYAANRRNPPGGAG